APPDDVFVARSGQFESPVPGPREERLMIHWPHLERAQAERNGHRPLALLDRAVAPLLRPNGHRPVWRPQPCREPALGDAAETEPDTETAPDDAPAPTIPTVPNAPGAAYELVVRSVSIGSVARVAFCFALTGLSSLLVAVWVLWLLATGSGQMARFEDLL